MRCAFPSPLAVTEWTALAANNVMQQQTGPFCHWRGVTLATCVQFMFGKTSLALVLYWVVQHQQSVSASSLHATQDRKLLVKMVKANGLVSKDFGAG